MWFLLYCNTFSTVFVDYLPCVNLGRYGDVFGLTRTQAYTEKHFYDSREGNAYGLMMIGFDWYHIFLSADLTTIIIGQILIRVKLLGYPSSSLKFCRFVYAEHPCTCVQEVLMFSEPKTSSIFVLVSRRIKCKWYSPFLLSNENKMFRNNRCKTHFWIYA